MKTPKVFIYIIYLIFIGLSFAFIFYTDKLFDELGIQKTLNFLKNWSLFGLFLFLLSILFENLSLRNRRREINRLKKENEGLKAKIYDIEERERSLDQSMKAFEGSLKNKDQNK